MQYIDSVPEKEQYMIRAYFIKKAKDQAQAIELYKELLKLYPEEKEAIFIIGDLSFHEGDFGTAITYLERVLAMDPLSTRAWDHLCQALYFSEQYQRHLDAARQYRDNIQSLAAYRELGHAFSHNHDYRSAIQTFTEAAELFSDSSAPTAEIGGVYLLQENYQAAEAEFLKLLEKAVSFG